MPVTKSEAAELRNTAIPPKSAISPQRAAGVRASTLSCSPSTVARALGQIGIDPARQHGIDLDVVGRPGARAGAGELHDAAFARGIGRREAAPKIDIIEPILMILPPPASFIAG